MSEINFQELLKTINHEKFSEHVKANHKNYIDELPDFLRLIDKLLSMTPSSKKKGYIVLESSEIDENHSEAELYAKTEEQPHGCALDFCPWDEVLSYVVEPSTLEKNSVEEIAFQVLLDLSWDGFDEEEREKNINNLKERIANDDYEDYVPFSDVKRSSGKGDKHE